VNLIHYPPATAGGTDPIQACFWTFEAKLVISLKILKILSKGGSSC